MRILFVVEHFPSLSETFVLNQITGLLDRGHEVEIYALGLPTPGPVHPDVNRYRLIEHVWQKPVIPADRRRRILGAARLLRTHASRGGIRLLQTLNPARYGPNGLNLKLLYGGAPFLERRSQFDIVHCHFGSNGVNALAWRDAGLWNGKLSVVFHAHEIAGLPEDQGKRYYRTLLRSDARLLPISDFWRRKLVDWGADPSRVSVHRMGVDCDAIPFRPKPISPEHPIEIVSVCRLVEKKGLEYGIRALVALHRTFPLARLTIVGDGPLRSELQRLSQELGAVERVSFAGAKSQDEVQKILSRSQICLVPSVTAPDGQMEGIPVSIMEAMAAGLPVVSTKHSGIPELIENGVSGVLSEEKDVTGLVKGLTRLIREPEFLGSIQLAGRRVIEKKFNSPRLVSDLERIFREEMTHS